MPLQGGEPLETFSLISLRRPFASVNIWHRDQLQALRAVHVCESSLSMLEVELESLVFEVVVLYSDNQTCGKSIQTYNAGPSIRP